MATKFAIVILFMTIGYWSFGQSSGKKDSLIRLYQNIMDHPDSIQLKKDFLKEFPQDFKTFNQYYGINGILETQSYQHQKLYFKLLSDSTIINKKEVLGIFIKISNGYINYADFVQNYSTSAASLIYRNIKDSDLISMLNPDERKQFILFIGKTNYGMNKLILEEYLKSELLREHHKQIRKILKKWK